MGQRIFGFLYKHRNNLLVKRGWLISSAILIGLHVLHFMLGAAGKPFILRTQIEVVVCITIFIMWIILAVFVEANRVFKYLPDKVADIKCN